MGIKCIAILPTLGMPRNQNQARSSELPEQPKYSNDTGYTKLKRVFGQGAGKRNECITILRGPKGNKNTKKGYENIKSETALSQNRKKHTPSQ